MLMSISSYCQQPKHRRDLISAFQEAFSTVGKQGARGIFEETLRLEREKKGKTTSRTVTVNKKFHSTRQNYCRGRVV